VVSPGVGFRHSPVLRLVGVLARGRGSGWPLRLSRC
jgi:hypothetical protein